MQMYSGHYQEISYVQEEHWSWGSKHSPLAKVRWSDCEANIAIPTRGQKAKLRPGWSELIYKCKLSEFAESTPRTGHSPGTLSPVHAKR